MVTNKLTMFHQQMVTSDAAGLGVFCREELPELEAVVSVESLAQNLLEVRGQSQGRHGGGSPPSENS